MPGAQAEGTPRHELFLYAAWRATEKLTFTPSLELASERAALVTGSTSTLLLPPATRRPNYVNIGAYTVANIQAEYVFTAGTTGAIGVTNLFDDNYELAEGFPEAGRQFFANFRTKF